MHFLGSEHTLLGQFFIHQYPQVLLHRVLLNLLITQPVSMFGIAPTPHLTFSLVELHEWSSPLLSKFTCPGVHLSRLPSYQGCLEYIPSPWRMNHTTQLGVICKPHWGWIHCQWQWSLPPTMSNGVVPSGDPWGMPLLTGLHLGTKSSTISMKNTEKGCCAGKCQMLYMSPGRHQSLFCYPPV